MDSVDLRFTCTESEHARAVRLYYDKVFHGKFDALLAVTFVGFGCLIGFGWHEWLIAELIIAFGIVILALIGYCYLIKPSRLYQNDPTLKEEFHFTFSDAGIHFQMRDMDSQIGWSLFRTVWHSQDLIVLVHGKQSMTILPLRAFGSQTDIETMNRLLERNITKIDRIDKQGISC